MEVGADGNAYSNINYASQGCESKLIQDALFVASRPDPRNADFNFNKLKVHQLEQIVDQYEYARRCVPAVPSFDDEYRRNARGLLNFRLISAGKSLSELRESSVTDVKKNDELKLKVSGWCNDYRVELPAGVTPPFGYFVMCCEWYRNILHDRFAECTNEAIALGEWPSIIQRPSQEYTPGLRTQAVWDIEDLPWSNQLAEIAENTPTILKEVSVRDVQSHTHSIK